MVMFKVKRMQDLHSILISLTDHWSDKKKSPPALRWRFLFKIPEALSQMVFQSRIYLIWTQRSIPPLQVCRALSGEWGGCLCQWELKAHTDRSRSDCVHEQVAKRIANVRFTQWAILKIKKQRESDKLPLFLFDCQKIRAYNEKVTRSMNTIF